MRTGYWIALFGSVAAFAVFACSSSDSGSPIITGKGGGVMKGGSAGTGNGGSAQGGQGNGGTAQGGQGNGGTAQGGQGQGGGGTGGSTAGCASGETCTDVSGGAGTPTGACIPADVATMTECTGGLTGSGCGSGQSCMYFDSLSAAICLNSDMTIPAGAATCDQSTPCANANEMCVTPQGGASKCVVKDCTPPSCPNGMMDLYAQDSNGVPQACVCANPCQL